MSEKVTEWVKAQEERNSKLSKEWVAVNALVLEHMEKANMMVKTQEQKQSDFVKEQDKKVRELAINQSGKLIGDQMKKLNESFKSQEAKFTQLIENQVQKVTRIEASVLSIQDKLPSIYFDAYRSRNFHSQKTIKYGDFGRLSYDGMTINSPHSGMDIDTGIFRAPIAGVYYFSFHGTKFEEKTVNVCIHHNSNIMARAHDCGDNEATVTVSSLLSLSEGDTVEVLISGHLNSSYPDYNTFSHFQGFLITKH